MCAKTVSHALITDASTRRNLHEIGYELVSTEVSWYVSRGCRKNWRGLDAKILNFLPPRQIPMVSFPPNKSAVCQIDVNVS